MPYIKQEQRKELNTDDTYAKFPQNLGELDYVLTKTVVQYIKEHQLSRFSDFAGIIGVLDLIKDETRKRIVDPYEAQKRHDNGDVY